MIDDEKLAAEIAKPDYKGMAAVDIATALNAKTVTTHRSVPLTEAVAVLRLSMEWYAIRKNAASDAPLTAAIAVMDLWEDHRESELDFSRPIVGTMLKELIDGGLISQATADALVALGVIETPLWATLGHRELDHGDMIRAQGKRWEDVAGPNNEIK